MRALHQLVCPRLADVLLCLYCRPPAMEAPSPSLVLAMAETVHHLRSVFQPLDATLYYTGVHQASLIRVAC